VDAKVRARRMDCYFEQKLVSHDCGRRKSFAGRWCRITFEELRVYALAARKQSCVEGILRAGSCDKIKLPSHAYGIISFNAAK